MPRIVLLPCTELSHAYTTGYSTVALGRRYSCSPTTIAKRLRHCGITLRRARFVAIAIDAELLRQAYLAEHLPIAQIATRFGVSPSTIANKRRAYGIPIRPRRRACSF
ncbi:MAG: hypothetical protein JST60_20820 [Chloroflexi bacterium SZAS-1]|jgi:transcriptional regulator of aromatic amino acid metabolism|nr:hypothetical protein [Chloroflexi bacterium SZAS-1]HNP87434.1 hypothetical protein [Kouleothrix sp.]